MIEFFVEGVPVGKERPRVVNKNGKTSTFTPAKTKAYEQAISWAAIAAKRKANVKMFETPVRVFIYVNDTEIKKRRPDLDNVVKTILDGMNKIVYQDDSAVLEIIAKYQISNKTGVRVIVEEKLM